MDMQQFADTYGQLLLLIFGFGGVLLAHLRANQRADQANKEARTAQEQLNVKAQEYFQTRVDEQDARIDVLHQENSVLVRQITDVNEKLAYAEGLSHGRLERIEQQDKRILELRTMYERSEDKITELEGLKERFTNLQTQHDKILKEFQSAKEQNATLLKQNEQLRKDLKAERDMNAELRKQLKELSDKLDASNNKILDLSRQLEDVNKQIQQVSAENAELQHQLTNIEKQNESNEAA